MISPPTGQTDETYLLDTGHTGGVTVESDDEWDISCGIGDGTSGGEDSPYLMLNNKPLADLTPGYDLGFYQIFLRAYDGSEPAPSAPNVAVGLDPNYYTATCPVTFTKTNDDPYEADVRPSICRTLLTRGGAPARLDSALFHLKCVAD